MTDFGHKPLIGGGVVEADETYFERGGKIRSVHISGDMFDGINKKALKDGVSPEAVSRPTKPACIARSPSDTLSI